MPAPLQQLLRARHAAWWTLVVGLALTATLGWKIHHDAVEMDRRRLTVRVAEVAAQLDARLEKSEMLLHNLRDYLMFSGEHREQVFARWCYENGLSINCPWLHGILVATNANQAQWRDKMPKPLEEWTPTEWEAFFKLARNHLVDCQIAMRSEVKDGMQFAARLGFQQEYAGSEPLARAIHGSRIGMSERKAVMKDANRNDIIGTLYFVPVYNPEVANLLAVAGLNRNQTTYIRWMHLTSLIIAPVDFKELARSVWDGAPADLGMELFASKELATNTWLDSSTGTPRAADPNFKAYLTHRRDWPMYGAMFSIFFYTTPLFEAQSPRRLAKIAMIASTVVTLLATALVGVAGRAHERQQRMTEQIRDARDALAAAQKEREQLSHDLHDGTVQSLYALQLALDHTGAHFETDPKNGHRRLAALRQELDAVIAEIRHHITAEAREEKPMGIAAVLQALVRRARVGAAARIDLLCDPGAAARLSGDQAVQLANITREAMSNSLRHAKPSRVDVTLRSDGEDVVLEIADDGAGFDPKSPGRAGVGLTSLPARARELGGVLDIQSAPGKGTRVVVRLPAAVLEPVDPESDTDADDEA